MKTLPLAITMVAFVGVLGPIVLLDHPWPVGTRDFMESRAVDQTGSPNLVSALYLAYRAFDTLGETLVLMVAIAGALVMLHRGPAMGNDMAGQVPDRGRTELLQAVTGKLAPIVLLFGFYLMTFGHLSPGGGFQGGTAIASGIVFMAMGSSRGRLVPLTRPQVLGVMELAAVLLLVTLPMAGLLASGSFFGDPFQPLGIDKRLYLILFNSLIGLKVGAGLGYMGIVMLSGGTGK